MKEYPFSGMRPEQALEYLWLEFNAYKEKTDKKIALLEEQLMNLENKTLDVRKNEEIRAMIDDSYNSGKEKSYENALKDL